MDQGNETVLPVRPYPGLFSYTEQYQNIFSGREGDLQECYEKIRDAKVVVLHGFTGCGKSSFLRAGLKPYFDQKDESFQFPAPQDNETNLFLRAGHSPLDRLARRLASLASIYSQGRGPLQTMEEKSADLILKGFDSAKHFVDVVGKQHIEMIRALGRFREIVCETPIIVVDQAEEIFTLDTDDKHETDRQEFFGFLVELSKSNLSVRVCIAMRTEYKGLFDDELEKNGLDLRQITGVFLPELDRTRIKLAILKPTDSLAFKKYQFQFDKDLPDKIAEALSTKPEPPGGVLPVLQVICNRLYDQAKSRGKQGGFYFIRDDDFRGLGDVRKQIGFYVEERLRQLVSGINYKFSRIDFLRQVDAWRLLLCRLVIEQPDGRGTTGHFSTRELADEAQRLGLVLDRDESPKNLEQLSEMVHTKLDWLAGEEVCLLRSVEDGKWALGHDSIGLALLRWKQEYDALVVERLTDETNPIIDGEAFLKPDLYEESDPGMPPELIEVTTIDTGIWDHQVPWFAKSQGFDERLGITIKDVFDGESTPSALSESVRRLLDHVNEGIILVPVPRVQFNKLDALKNIDQEWSDIAIISLYQGYSLIGHPEFHIGGGNILPHFKDIRDKARTKRRKPVFVSSMKQRRAFLVNFFSCLSKSTIWVWDVSGKSFVHALWELACHASERRLPKPTVKAVETQIVRGNDVICPKLVANRRDFGIGTAVSRAQAAYDNLEVYLDAEDVPALIEACSELDRDRDTLREKWKETFAKIYQHNTWQINVPSGLVLDGSHRATTLRLAAIAYYTVAYIRTCPEEFTRFIADRLQVDGRTAPSGLETGAIRASIAACYRFFALQEYDRLFFDRQGPFAYGSGPNLLVGATAEKVVFELITMRRTCHDILAAINKRLDEGPSITLERREKMKTLKEKAWRHYQIFNFYDAERYFRLAQQCLEAP